MQNQDNSNNATPKQPVAKNTQLLKDPPAKNSISAEDFLASALKTSVEDSVPDVSDGLTKSQPLSLPPSTPPENPVITALKLWGLYKGPSTLRPFMHDVTCPWCSEHTNAKDSGTVYFEPNDIFYIGGFKCQHYHCSERTIRQLLAYLDISIA
jgi:hypothetical protein